MALERPQTMTVEEYFQFEENDPNGTRYEYEDGYVYAMAGGTANHDTISGNIYTILRNLLRGKGCRVYTGNMKVPVTETRYYYPDVTVTCDARDRGTTHLLRSPRLVIEVLSPSTDLADHTRKLQAYCAHPTIEEYLLVDARRVRAETYRKEASKWIYEILAPNDEITLNSLGVHFLLADADVDVEFEEISDDER